jgi:segregation and condensation protein A
MHQFKLPDFEGPLDLLLQLIEHRELDITKVSLAAVTDQYLDLVATPGTVDLSRLADYLVIAARLILIKSRLLLPHADELTPGSEEDVGEALARQLREYRMFKRAAVFLRDRTRAGLHSYRRFAPPPRPQPSTWKLEGVDADDLVHALETALLARPGLPQGTLEVPLRVSIEQKIRAIVDLTLQSARVHFSRLLQQANSRVEVIVTFLAVLELIKLRKIDAQQDRLFGEIVLLRRDESALAAAPDSEQDAGNYTIE